ncbi:Putative toxin-antitoxin system, toxin component [Neorhizobium galegae bv. officinalis bv. officinalis str. HAMBI 1141]|uniref:Putative toxin-antitoxin system, toxin component n=2 Tax=Neorhizobium galegae TaxID=399 RepID=A0A068T8T1_NEOGA|nr:Putative toxin-antitoxin system, toxin component [Neorhizobium galegae bv. officinalis bv. officinalis str. HAMBI 1141]
MNDWKWYNFYIILVMKFEFDPDKSATNKDKHGIDFVEAQALWADERRTVAPVQSDTESRYILTGKIAEKHWTAVYTWRGDWLRIISVRRARDKEKQTYEDNNR